jgi:hypothetical protein
VLTMVFRSASEAYLPPGVDVRWKTAQAAYDFEVLY